MDSEVERDIQKALKIAGRQAKSQVQDQYAVQAHLPANLNPFLLSPLASFFRSIYIPYVPIQTTSHSFFSYFVHLFSSIKLLHFSSSTEYITFGVLVPCDSR